VGPPLKSDDPTPEHVLTELMSAMSALNMPDPEHCPPEMVKHAYEHLEGAVEMLTTILRGPECPNGPKG
jgi:hypothetical protein